jgi:tryptophanyl-tRNA synthetase
VNRPKCRNLLYLHAIVSGQTKESVAVECREMGWGPFKPLLTEAMIAHLAPIQAKYQEVVSDRSYLESVLRQGREQAEVAANQTLADVKAALGFSLPL